MPIITSLTVADISGVDNELRMDSGRSLSYVAPVKIPISAHHLRQADHCIVSRKNKRSVKYIEDSLHSDEWEGVHDFCQVLDNAIEFEIETGLFEGKRVLEIGFATGLPTVFAVNNGAREVALHCLSATTLECFVKPTMMRNDIAIDDMNFTSGQLANALDDYSKNRYNVVLAPELLHNKKENYGALHDFIDQVLSDDGIVLLSGRTYYTNCDGNLPAFLELVKQKGRFDAIIRWSLPNRDLAPRKFVQLTRKIR